MENVEKLAFDRATVRRVDQDGRLHVEICNLSKAAVNPYYGREIPDAASLGLDPDTVYQILRDPAELKKAAETFNNIPLLDRHIPVSIHAPQKEFIVGSTGTDAKFDDPFLRNSLVVWDATAIAGINTKQQRELSCGYRYKAVKESGVFEGVPYDLRMIDIKGNHVALVEAGRAGPDVVVGDSKLSEKPRMKKLSANARAVKAAITGLLLPILAQDAQIGDLTAIVGGVKSLKGAKEQERIVNAVSAAYGDKLAQDATLDALPGLLVTLAQDESEDPPAPKKVAEAAAEDEDDEDLDDDGKPKKKDDKQAMDAAIAAAVAKAQGETVARMQAIQQAEREVEPLIGRLAIAQDSAEAVYRLALDSAKVDHAGITDVKALRAMVGMLPKPGAVKERSNVTLAQDAKGGAGDFKSMFPNAGAMKGGV